MNTGSETRCGVVAIAGSPNVGKSTLLNNILETKVTIVSPKVQTTRTRVRGIHVRGEVQIVFLDTPGVFAPRRRLDRAMVSAAFSGMSEADVPLVLVDSARGVDEETRRIAKHLAQQGRQAVLVLNKIDRIAREKLLALSAELMELGVFSDVFMISALTGDGVGDLVSFLESRMPPGAWLFPEEDLSDMPDRLMAAEITREHVFRRIHQEIPYGVAVDPGTWEEKEDGSVRLEQNVFVSREAHRKILLGKGGQTIRAIGTAAREELGEILERPVHLFLQVKVREKWQEDRTHYQTWGLDYNV